MWKRKQRKPKNRKWMERGIFPSVKTDTKDGLKLVLPQQLTEDDLPTVSVVTITKNRENFVGIMLHNWLQIKYPSKKLEWVILDDSDERGLEKYLPEVTEFNNIKYHYLDTPLKIADKRNKAVELANHEVIIHMDDDDFYFSDHVMAKVRVLLYYGKRGIKGVLSLPIGSYDLITDTSVLFDLKRNTNDVPEASLGYWKTYWEKNKFKSEFPNGGCEGRAFIGKNFKKWINMDYLFNMISITHNTNSTGNLRKVNIGKLEGSNYGDFKQVFPENFLYILENLKQIILI